MENSINQNIVSTTYAARKSISERVGQPEIPAYRRFVRAPLRLLPRGLSPSIQRQQMAPLMSNEALCKRLAEGVDAFEQAEVDDFQLGSVSWLVVLAPYYSCTAVAHAVDPTVVATTIPPPPHPPLLVIPFRLPMAHLCPRAS